MDLFSIHIWITNIDEEIMEKHTKNQLLVLLKKKAFSEDLTLSHLSKKLSVSPSYMSQLQSGQKPIDGVKDEFLRRCAEYLDLPAMTCFIVSGKIRANDFYASKINLKKSLDRALMCVAENHMSLDSGVSEKQLLQLSQEVKLLIVLLYQSAFSVQLLPKGFDRLQWETATGIRIPFQDSVC